MQYFYSFFFLLMFLVFLENIAAKLKNIIPAFNSSRSENTSTTCRIHTNQFFDALSRFELWAFQSK